MLNDAVKACTLAPDAIFTVIGLEVAVKLVAGVIQLGKVQVTVELEGALML